MAHANDIQICSSFQDGNCTKFGFLRSIRNYRVKIIRKKKKKLLVPQASDHKFRIASHKIKKVKFLSSIQPINPIKISKGYALCTENIIMIWRHNLDPKKIPKMFFFYTNTRTQQWPFPTFCSLDDLNPRPQGRRNGVLFT